MFMHSWFAVTRLKSCKKLTVFITDKMEVYICQTVVVCIQKTANFLQVVS